MKTPSRPRRGTRIRFFATALAAICITAAPASARADGTDDKRAKAEEHVERGKRLGELGRYEDSIKEFEEAYLLEPIPEILLNIALSYRYLSEFDRSIEIYERYLKLRPDATNRKEIEKRIAALRKEKAAAAKKAAKEAKLAKATLRITSDPPGAKVSRGDKVLGKTPLEAKVTAGDYLLRFELVGHESRDVVGSVKPGKEASVAVALAPLRDVAYSRGPGLAPGVAAGGHLTVDANVPGAEVFVDEELVGHTPMARMILLPEGVHRVVVNAPALVAPHLNVVIERGRIASHVFTLTPENPEALELFLTKKDKFLASGLTMEGFWRKKKGWGELAWGIGLVSSSLLIALATYSLARPGGGPITPGENNFENAVALAVWTTMGGPPLIVGGILGATGIRKIVSSKKMVWERPGTDLGDVEEGEEDETGPAETAPASASPDAEATPPADTSDESPSP